MMHPSRTKSDGCQWVGPFVLEQLRQTSEPLTRDQIATAVQWESRARGLCWSSATAARRVREAIGALECDGVPVVSDGRAFLVARTPEQRATAVRKLERMALSLLRRAARIKGLGLAGELHQVSLFGETA